MKKTGPKGKQRGASAWQTEDTFQSREAKVYEQPIPSREYLMEFLAEAGKFQTLEKLIAALALEGDAAVGLERRLQAMARDGQLVRNRRNGYGPVKKVDLIAGRVVGHPDGYGFVIPDEGGEDLYLHSRQMRQLMHGDRALFRIAGVDHRGRKEGQVVEILERNTRQVVGRYLEEHGIGLVAPDNRRVNHDVMIPPGESGRAKVGQIVVAELVDHPTKRTPATGRIVEVLGDHMGPGMEIDIAIRSHDIPHEWPAAVLDEIKAFGTEVPEAQKRDRWDLTEMPLVTIDGPDAKDFDDAVYCEPAGSGWRLLVAIADVSAYVAPGTALDNEAYNRGTSVYFPGRVVPMLPEILSNGLCSLNPQVERLCMVCDMRIDRNGNITRSSFDEAVMRSHARLTYDEVWGILSGEDPLGRRRHDKLVGHLEDLYALFKVLRKARKKRGAIEFESTETRIIFGREKKIERVEPTVRNDAHMVIEECMIAANVAAARHLSRKHIPALYRVHDSPSVEKLAVLREFLKGLGLRLGGGDKPQPADYAQLAASVQDRPDARLISTVMLRSMMQAVYSPTNTGHFGLAHDNYAHFTSPIRRYPDLLVHRAIRHLLTEKTAKNYRYSPTEMAQLGEHCSMCERRADDATRDALSWLKCEYMVDKIGEEFDGVISAVTSFGLFVELDGIYIEGLIHVTGLKNDYYHFEPGRHLLMGERSGVSYRLGDPIRIQVTRVDLDERKIDFALPGGESAPRAKKPAKGARKGKRKDGDKPQHKQPDSKKKPRARNKKKPGARKPRPRK